MHLYLYWKYRYAKYMRIAVYNGEGWGGGAMVVLYDDIIIWWRATVESHFKAGNHWQPCYRRHSVFGIRRNNMEYRWVGDSILSSVHIFVYYNTSTVYACTHIHNRQTDRHIYVYAYVVVDSQSIWILLCFVLKRREYYTKYYYRWVGCMRGNIMMLITFYGYNNKFNIAFRFNEMLNIKVFFTVTWMHHRM